MSSIIATKEKPWSIDDFELYRPGNVEFCKRELICLINDLFCRRILIRAPVKSGKREFAEYMALRDASSAPTRMHIFISAWHRSADDDQRSELKQHNLKVFPINNKKNKEKCINFITSTLSTGIELVIHLDECDHGSGSRQLLSSIWRLIRDNELCKTILYSATPEEALFSKDFITESTEDDQDYEDMLNEFEDTAHVVQYIPSAAFCGPSKFLEEGLVQNAKPFFEESDSGQFQLTEQGKQITHDLEESMRNPETAMRNLLFLRLSYSSKKCKGSTKKDSKAIYQFLMTKFHELTNYSIIVDKNDDIDIPIKGFRCTNIEWSNRQFWDDLTSARPVIIVYDQTCSRSTELACHDRIFATHDFRNSVNFSVLSQAQERPNHYSTKYGGFQRIRIYGHLPTFQLSAGLISYQEYLSLRYKKKLHKTTKMFQIIDKINDAVESEYLTAKSAELRLMELGCFAEPALSSRVNGSIKNVVVCDTDFIPCDSTNFDRDARPRIQSKLVELSSNGKDTKTKFMNPFLAAGPADENGQIRGYLRRRAVFDYSQDIETSGWGFSLRSLSHASKPIRIHICYKDGVLGVGYRIPTGTRQINQLTSYKSQYKS